MKKVSFYNRLSFRVGLITLLLILISIGVSSYIDIVAQNETIVNTRLDALREEMEILHISIKNNMLAGEAPIAVQLFKDFARSDFITDVQLYRADGTPAFSDNDTIEVVNDYLDLMRFEPKTVFQSGSIENSEQFQNAVSNVDDIFITHLNGSEKMLTAYTPLINQPKCASCHGLDHVVRGVICISSPLSDVFMATRRNVIFTSVIALVGIAFLSLTISLFLNSSVISKILQIGEVAERVGEGDFKQRLTFKSSDEIGRLAVQMNTMIDGLNERFKLSKFVSKSTLEHVQSSEEIALGGERREVTVLFTDIRGFTSYSESRDPEEVMSTLNDVMELQSQIIHKFNGDIDKYVGDEIMAIFTGDDMVIRACKAAVEIREALMHKQNYKQSEIAVGMGINTGLVVMGNMGSADRIDRTVIGDTVNLGARLCSIAGKNTIVVSEFSKAYLKSGVSLAAHKAIKVKGKSQAVNIFTLKEIV